MFSVPENMRLAINSTTQQGSVVWFVPDLMVENMHSDFSAVCRFLIHEYAVLPLICRAGECMLIFRESGLFFRMHFLVDASSSVSIRLEHCTNIGGFAELLNDGPDEGLAIDNVVAFVGHAVSSGENSYQQFPICLWIYDDLFSTVVARICERFSAVPVRISHTQFSVVVGEMVITGRVNTIPIVDEFLDDDDMGPTYHEIELWAYPEQFRSVGYME